MNERFLNNLRDKVREIERFFGSEAKVTDFSYGEIQYLNTIENCIEHLISNISDYIRFVSSKEDEEE